MRLIYFMTDTFKLECTKTEKLKISPKGKYMRKEYELIFQKSMLLIN